MLRNYIAVMVAMSIFLSGCGSSAAPVDKQVADEIAGTMMDLISKKGYPVPITSAQAVEVLVEAFDKVGYSYSATLREIAAEGVSLGNPDKFQFAVFLLMPATVMQPGQTVDMFYSGEE